VLLACYGNVPPERASHVMGMLLGAPVSVGWVDKAATRVCAQLGQAGFDEAMIAGLTAEDVPLRRLSAVLTPGQRRLSSLPAGRRSARAEH
jgi:hypothetical protein